MGMLDRVKGITPYANSGQLKPRRGAKPDTHTVRDDSGNTTAAQTERIKAKTAREDSQNADRRKMGMPEQPRERIKIGSTVETWHEPKSPEGKAILKDKAGKAKAIKKVNKESSKDPFAYERADSYTRAKKDEDQWGEMSGAGGSATAYIKGGSKAEMKQNDTNEANAARGKASEARAKADLDMYTAEAKRKRLSGKPPKI